MRTRRDIMNLKPIEVFSEFLLVKSDTWMHNLHQVVVVSMFSAFSPACAGCFPANQLRHFYVTCRISWYFLLDRIATWINQYTTGSKLRSRKCQVWFIYILSIGVTSNQYHLIFFSDEIVNKEMESSIRFSPADISGWSNQCKYYLVLFLLSGKCIKNYPASIIIKKILLSFKDNTIFIDIFKSLLNVWTQNVIDLHISNNLNSFPAIQGI